MLPVPRVRPHHISYVCCFECDEYGHIAADYPHRKPPSATPACHRRHHSYTRHHTRSTSQHHRDRHRHSRSRSQSHSCRYQSHSHDNSHRSHSRSHHRCTLRHCHSSTYHYHCDTPHRRSSACRSLSIHSRDNSRSRPCTSYKPSKNTSCKNSSS